jgi:hypothetical protein
MFIPHEKRNYTWKMEFKSFNLEKMDLSSWKLAGRKG